MKKQATSRFIGLRLNSETSVQLDELAERFPLFSRSKIITVAVKYWMADALKYGVDVNLQPLKPKGKD